MTSGVATVTIKHPSGAVDFKEEDIMEANDTFAKLAEKVKTLPAHQVGEVGISMGITIPTQPYMSIRADVHIRVPCPSGLVDPVYEHCKNWADQKLVTISNEVEQVYGPAKK